MSTSRRHSGARWVFWLIAALAWFSPTPTKAYAAYGINGAFSSSGGKWIGASGGQNCDSGLPSLGEWQQNALNFSYQTSTVTQTLTIAEPSELLLTYEVTDRTETWIDAEYKVDLSDSNETVTSSWQTAPDITTEFGMEITTSIPNEVITISISGNDGPNVVWAGCYGAIFTNMSLLGEPVAAAPQTGVYVRGYEITTNPPLRVDSISPDCTTSYENINNWPETYMAGCRTNQVMLHYTGNIVVPVSQAQFRLYSDDGSSATIGNTDFGYWGIRACNYTESPVIQFTPGQSVPLDAWFYEWGGGECMALWWNIGNGWEVVPASAFTTQSTPTTTTTTTTTTTIPSGNYSGGGCGPYSPIYVTGTTNGSGWGAGPFTDDSNFNAMAVFAGLVDPGESAWIEPYDVNLYASYVGGSNNGVTTSAWGSDWCGFNIKIYGSPTPTTTTTTIPKFLGQPTNLSVSNSEDGVAVSWNSSDQNSGVSPERYAISWSTGESGWGIATGNVGDENSLNTEITLGYQLFSSTGGLGTEYSFTVRADNDTHGVYSQPSEAVQLVVDEPTPPTTTTEPEPEPTIPPTTLPDEPDTTIPSDTIPTVPDTIDGGPDGGTGDSADTTSPEATVPQSAPEEETPDTTPGVPIVEPDTEQVVDDILADDPSPEELADAVENALNAAESDEELIGIAVELLTSDLDAEQFAAVVSEVFSQDLSDEALTELVSEVFSQDLSDEEIASVVDEVFTADLSDEAFTEVLNTVFEEPLSDEAFESVIDAILDEPISEEAFDELVDVLGSDTVSDEQVIAAVDTIIENGIDESQALSIASSGEVLESITGDQASEIFATVDAEELDESQAAEVIEAVQDAPQEVRESFEEEIDIFSAGTMDTYVPIGSSVPVSTRRTLIAATAAVVAAMPTSSPQRGRIK